MDVVDPLVGVVQNAITVVSLARRETPLALIEAERRIGDPREPASDRRDEGLADDA